MVAKQEVAGDVDSAAQSQAQAKERLTYLRKLLDNPGPQVLETLDGQVAAAEGELARLKQTRRLLETFINGPKTRASPANGNGRATAGRHLHEQIAKYLLHSGPTKQSALVAALSSSPGSVSGTITRYRQWFDREPDGVHLTDKGRRLAEDL